MDIYNREPGDMNDREPGGFHGQYMSSDIMCMSGSKRSSSTLFVYFIFNFFCVFDLQNQCRHRITHVLLHENPLQGRDTFSSAGHKTFVNPRQLVT